MIIDRTNSMSNSELDNAKNAAKAVLELYNPEVQHVGLGVLGPKDPADPCDYKAAGDGGQWLAVPLSDDYKNADGSLNTSSALVSTINCLKNSRGLGTNLGDPVRAARVHLETSGRPDVKQGIILFTDGAANRPVEGNPCFFAGNQADEAKNQDIEIFTIGFGVGNVRCLDDNIAPYENELVTRLR